MSVGLAGSRLLATARHVIDASRAKRTLPDSPSARRWARARTFQRVASALVQEFNLEIRVIGPLPLGRVLLVSNHLSYLDPLVLSAIVPNIPLAKREILSWPVLGPMIDDLGAIFVDRCDIHDRVRALRQARRVLSEGVSVLNFPEATTTRGDIVFPFRYGLIGMAATMKVPIVPARIDYADSSLAWVDDDHFLPHFFRFARRPSTAVTVRFGAPIAVREGDDAELIAERARRTVAHLHHD
jgi:1-acyl-sn-glycerol-3-phosphate acyltransferase